MLNYKFGPGNTYILACNYGAESMALLHLMMEAGVKPVVAFVDYHVDPAMEKAESDLRMFADEKGLTYECLDVKEKAPEDAKFGEWSRKIRYDFFKSVYAKYKAAALFIAHDQDDAIESYLYMKEKGIKHLRYESFGKVQAKEGMIVVRPLLAYSGEDLRNYCDKNGIPYSRDVSNFEANYLESTIRREVVDNLNEVERDQIMEEMKKENAEKISFVQSLEERVKSHDELYIREIMALSESEFAETILEFVNAHAPTHCTITPKILQDIRALALDPKPIMSYHLRDSYYLVKEYDVITFNKDGANLPYSYVMEAPGKLSNEVFDLDFTMGAEDRGIKAEDYPITIRTALPQDIYSYHGYAVPVRRMMVASGMSARLLRVWPVFLNKGGKVIYVPRYVRGFSEYHTSVLKIHVKEEEK